MDALLAGVHLNTIVPEIACSGNDFDGWTCHECITGEVCEDTVTGSGFSTALHQQDGNITQALEDIPSDPAAGAGPSDCIGWACHDGVDWSPGWHPAEEADAIPAAVSASASPHIQAGLVEAGTPMAPVDQAVCDGPFTMEADPIYICQDLKMNGLHYRDTYTAAVYDIPSEPSADFKARQRKGTQVFCLYFHLLVRLLAVTVPLRAAPMGGCTAGPHDALADASLVCFAGTAVVLPAGKVVQVSVDTHGQTVRHAKQVSRATPAHLVLASHAVALAAVQGVCKGDMTGVKDEAVVNAQSVTPVGAFIVQELLLNKTSPMSEEMRREVIGRITIEGRPVSEFSAKAGEKGLARRLLADNCIPLWEHNATIAL